MFRGQFTHCVDAKGRISLPARFRDSCSPRRSALILAPALFDPCLHLYPMRAWEEFEQRMASCRGSIRTWPRFRRMYVSAAVECELDGRAAARPPGAPQKVQLEKEQRSGPAWAELLELWSKDKWEAAMR